MVKEDQGFPAFGTTAYSETSPLNQPHSPLTQVLAVSTDALYSLPFQSTQVSLEDRGGKNKGKKCNPSINLLICERDAIGNVANTIIDSNKDFCVYSQSNCSPLKCLGKGETDLGFYEDCSAVLCKKSHQGISVSQHPIRTRQ